MASAFSNILNLLSLGSGRIKENDEFGLEVTEDGIQTTGDRYTQSGLGRFINRVGGKQTADDMNRAFENALMKAEMDMKIQQMQGQAQAQSAQDLARLNNSLMGQRELDAFTRNRGATKEDQAFDKQTAEEAALRQFLLAEKAKESDLGRVFLRYAGEQGISPEEAMNPAYRSLIQQLAISEMDLANINNMSGVRNQANLNRLGNKLVNIRGMEDPVPLSAAQALGAGALNLYENPEDQELRRQLLQAQIARHLAAAEPEPSPFERLNSMGIEEPISFNENGKQGVLIGTDVKLFNNPEDRLKYLRERE